MSVVAATKCGGDGPSICFALFLEEGETLVGRVADDSGQLWVLEVGLFEVDCCRHCRNDKSISSVTKGEAGKLKRANKTYGFVLSCHI